MITMKYKCKDEVVPMQRSYSKKAIDRQLNELKSLKPSFLTYLEKMLLLSFSAMIETEVGRYEISREFENAIRDHLVLPVIRDDELRDADECLRYFFYNVEDKDKYNEASDPVYQFYRDLENDADLQDNFKNLSDADKKMITEGNQWYHFFFKQLSEDQPDENGHSYQKIFPMLRGNPYLKFAFIYLLVSECCQEDELWKVLVRMAKCTKLKDESDSDPTDDNLETGLSIICNHRRKKAKTMDQQRRSVRYPIFDTHYCKSIQFDKYINICIENTLGDKVGLDLENTKNALNYVCFYAICTFLRRKHQPKLLNGFIKKFANFQKPKGMGRNKPDKTDFEGFVSYDHIRLESIKSEDIKEEDLKEAEDLVLKMRDQAGVKMMYGNMVADYCEEYPDRYEERSVRRHVEKALKKLNGKEEHLAHYPKTHIIKARLLALQKNYQSALESAKEGIKLQRAHEKDNDYMERLTAFYDIRMTIEVEEQVEKIREVERKMEGQELKNLEMLSIFTAVIGLLTGVFSLVSIGGGGSGKEVEVRSTIITLTGAVILAYSFFYALIHSVNLRKNFKMKVWLPIIIVGVGVLGGIAILLFSGKIAGSF